MVSNSWIFLWVGSAVLMGGGLRLIVVAAHADLGSGWSASAQLVGHAVALAGVVTAVLVVTWMH